MSAPIPLRELDGELTTTTYTGGLRLPSLTFICPLCDGKQGRPCHYNAIHYSDAPPHEIPRPGAGPTDPQTIKLWQRVGGTTLDNFTLAPSYHLSGRYRAQDGTVRSVPTCGLHGYIRGGAWVWC